MEPKLTDNILRGLATLATRAEAEMPEDLLGEDDTGRSEAAHREADEIGAAIEWIRTIRHQHHVAARRAKRDPLPATPAPAAAAAAVAS